MGTHQHARCCMHVLSIENWSFAVIEHSYNATQLCIIKCTSYIVVFCVSPIKPLKAMPLHHGHQLQDLFVVLICIYVSIIVSLALSFVFWHNLMSTYSILYPYCSCLLCMQCMMDINLMSLTPCMHEITLDPLLRHACYNACINDTQCIINVIIL